MSAAVPQKFSDLQRRLFQAKAEKNLSFGDIAKELGRNEVATAGIFYNQAKASLDELEKLSKLLNIPIDELMNEFGPHVLPDRGGLMTYPPADPLLYRLNEMVQVHGYPLKHVIYEKFGDGVMSAINFTATVDKEQDPEGGERVLLTFSGKFLPTKK